MATNIYLPDTNNSRLATVWKPAQSDNTCVPPVADFSVEFTTAEEDTVVQFTDASTGDPGIAWAWDFGDGNTSSQQNPTNIYEDPGNYTVTLAVTNACGTAFEVKIDYMVITACIPPVASFVIDDDTGSVPHVVQFNDTSSGSNNSGWAWDFGDGDTSTEQNPSHTYTAAGSYTVTLEVTNACGTDSATDSVSVTGTLLLDSITFDIFYALVRVREAYTGPLIRVRNSSTDVETDIGYLSDNTLDIAALTTAIGANSAYVVTWYDQSGNGYHVTQADPTKQPLLVSSGTYLTYVQADGSNDYLASSTVTIATQVMSVVSVGKEFQTFANNKTTWRIGTPFYHCHGNGLDSRLLYGMNLQYYVAVDSTGTSEAVRISTIDTSSLLAATENTVYENGSIVNESYQQGNAVPGIGDAPVYMFSDNLGASNASSRRRAWGAKFAILTSDERATVDAYTWN